MMDINCAPAGWSETSTFVQNTQRHIHLHANNNANNSSSNSNSNSYRNHNSQSRYEGFSKYRRVLGRKEVSRDPVPEMASTSPFPPKFTFWNPSPLLTTVAIALTIVLALSNATTISTEDSDRDGSLRLLMLQGCLTL
jgi:hypothetical protein